MKTGRLGIYGGSFNPFHNGHKLSAETFVEEAKLDKLLIMPAFVPPHKRLSDGDDPYHRLNMLKNVFRDPRIEISDYEIEKKGVSYTYQTLEYFSEFCDELYFLLGTDMLLSLDRWKNPNVIFSLCTIVCLVREKTENAMVAEKKTEYEKKYGARIMLPKYSPIELSSTEVRERLEKGENIDGLVPKTVAEYIKKYGLYGK